MALRSWLNKRRRGSTSNVNSNNSLSSNIGTSAAAQGGNNSVVGTSSDGGDRQPLLSSEAVANETDSCKEPLPVYEVVDPLPITSYDEVA